MRKLLVGSLVLLCGTLGWSAGGVAQKASAPRGELRVVDTDPNNWIWITYNVFEHLIEFDKDGKLVPRLASSWRWVNDRTIEFTLRQGVRFHNGEVFDAEIVKLFPRFRRIVFDNTLSQKEAVELVKRQEGRVDLVTGLSPVETLRVAQSPFAAVVKNRAAPGIVFGHFNMRKTGSPWTDVRLRQAVNLSINRADLIRYAANGNGVVIPALAAPRAFGYDPGLTSYPFDPVKARDRLREAGHPDGLPMLLIAPQTLEVQATVIGKMLEQAGFKVQLQTLDAASYTKTTDLSQLERPAEQQPWDIALTSDYEWSSFPAQPYRASATGSGSRAWGTETTELRRLYDLVLRTVDRDKQQELIRQMERHTRDQAYYLFLYNPIPLYAVNKAVAFVPYPDGWLRLAETSLTDQHWSVRKGGVKP